MVQPKGEWDATPCVFSAYFIQNKGFFLVPLHNICWAGDKSPSPGWGVETGTVSRAMLKCCQNHSWHSEPDPAASHPGQFCLLPPQADLWLVISAWCLCDDRTAFSSQLSFAVSQLCLLPAVRNSHGSLVEVWGFMENDHLWKGETIPFSLVERCCCHRGILSLGYQTNKVLSFLVSAIDEQRPCQRRLRGDLVSAQGRNGSCFSPLGECSLWVIQPAWSPYPSARTPDLTGTKTPWALLGSQVGHFEAHLRCAARNCAEVI